MRSLILQQMRLGPSGLLKYIDVLETQVGDHMQVIFFACKERKVVPAASRRPISTIRRNGYFLERWARSVSYLLQVCSRVMEIARGMGICIRGQRSCGKLQEHAGLIRVEIVR
jgi:hypothetical protein